MSSILKGSYCPSINGGTFNAITNTTYHAPRPTTGMERLMEAVSPNAFYDSDNRADPPKCHENTRVAVITKIMDWVTSKMDPDACMLCSAAGAPETDACMFCSAAGASETDAFMLWLYGPAGAGKTAIARRVAQLCEAQGLLLASFLFFRSDSKRNTMNPLVANIAYCIARVIPSTDELIKTTIEADPLILTYSIEVQLTKLVFQPLQLLAGQGYFFSPKFPRLVVIDGLDECLDQGAQTNLIQFLASAVAQNQLPLKFLIVSRPEPHIKSAVALASEKTMFSRLELNNDFLPDEDIRRFLTDKFREIKTCHPSCAGISSFWPSEQQMDDLICKASGQFIYASLVVRFVNSACDSPMRQLDIILGLRPPINHDLPFAELDALYTFILSCTKNLNLVLNILGVNSVVGYFSPNDPVKVVESVLYLENGDVVVYLSPLNSLLQVKIFPVNYDCDVHRICFHHASFTDFLDNPERSKDYYINAPKYHSLVAQWVLQMFTSSGRRCDTHHDDLMDLVLVRHLEHSVWTFELEDALEVFSLATCLNWIDCSDFVMNFVDKDWYDFPERFLHYLECKGKTDLYHHHLLGYMEYLNSSINNPPSREKFRIMSTVWFVLQKPIASLWRGIETASWERLCTKLFGLNGAEIDADIGYRLLRHPSTYDIDGERCMDSRSYAFDGKMYGLLKETKRLIPDPILSYRLARIALSCMRYLHRQEPNNSPVQYNLLAAWATKSKKLPWLWRRRLRGTRQPTLGYDVPNHSKFPRSLRRSHQMIYSEGIQSEDFYQERRIFYMWALDLLYHTLRAAMKSDELTKALLKPFIPSVACILFPRRIKQVQEAANGYLEKFSPSSLDASGMKRIVRCCTKYCPQRNVVSDSITSKQAPFTDRDLAERQLKRHIDNMLDLVYGPSGAHPESIASVNALFNRVDELGRELETQSTDQGRD